MKNKIYLAVLIFPLLFLASCTGEVLTEDDDGTRVEYAIGSEFQVQLKGNPDDGFMWKTVGLNRDVVNQIGDPVIRSAAETGEAYGTFIFTFKTVSAGNVVLRLMYYDKNSEDPEPEKTIEIEIISGTMGRIQS